MKELVIFGARAFADVAHYYFSHDSPYRVAAFTVDGAFLEGSSFRGLPLVAAEEIERDFPPDRYDMFVAVGHHQVNRQRAAKVAEAQARGYRLASFLSSKADAPPDLALGPNSMVMERATLQPFVTIGPDTIVWSTTRIGFHTRIGAHCWIVCALFGESVTLGDYSFVGLNATVGPSITVGQGNVIGAGALVLKSTRDHEVYKAAPSTLLPVRSDQLRNF